MREILRFPFFWISLLYGVLFVGSILWLPRPLWSALDLLTVLYLPCLYITYNRYFPRKPCGE